LRAPSRWRLRVRLPSRALKGDTCTKVGEEPLQGSWEISIISVSTISCSNSILENFFCNHSCSAKYNNTLSGNRYERSDEQKAKMREIGIRNFKNDIRFVKEGYTRTVR
jgi:hypothetical protein